MSLETLFKFVILGVAILLFLIYASIAVYVLIKAIKYLIVAVIDGRKRIQSFPEVPMMVRANPLNVILYSRLLTNEGIIARKKGVMFIAIFIVMVAVPAIGDSIIRNLLR